MQSLIRMWMVILCIVISVVMQTIDRNGDDVVIVCTVYIYAKSDKGMGMM